MFTGIIESVGKIINIEKNNDNLDFTLTCDFVSELKIDQSLAHNGVCLTVVAKTDKTYTVTAIKETLQKTNLLDLKINDYVNLERCMILNDRLDGHIVQGHVDQTGILKSIENQNGSFLLNFEHKENENITVEKGSICINGISLTVINSTKNSFSVAIIPYTWENTNMNKLSIKDKVNLEFDIIGKYVQKIHKVF